MGIRGLSSYLRNHNLYQTFYLPSIGNQNQDEVSLVPLIIDGPSLVHHLMDLSRPSYFIPSYSDFMELTRRFINLMQLTGFSPIHVWMDGSMDQQKLATDLKRECEKWQRLERLSQQLASNYSVPKRIDGILGYCSYAAFVQCLREMTGVEVHCALGEADHKAAEQAHDLNAFVLSNDSDFVVYDCPAGWIALNSLQIDPELLNYQRALPDQFSIIGHLFSRALLARNIGIDYSLVPLFGCLAGNDYFERGHFFKQPFHRLENLVDYLRPILKRVDSPELALKVLYEKLMISSTDSPGFEATLLQYNHFEIVEDSIYSQLNIHPIVLERLHAGLYDFQLFDVMLSKNFFCSVRMGTSTGKTSYEPFNDIRKMIYTLYTGAYDQTINEYTRPLVSQRTMAVDHVQLYSQHEIEKLLNLNENQSAPISIHEQLPTIAVKEKRKFLYKLFNTRSKDVKIKTSSWVPTVLMARFLILQESLRDFELLALILSSLFNSHAKDAENYHLSNNPVGERDIKLLSLWDCAIYHLMMSLQVLGLNELIADWNIFQCLNPSSFYFYLSVLKRGRKVEDLIPSQLDDVRSVYELCVQNQRERVGNVFNYPF